MLPLGDMMAKVVQLNVIKPKEETHAYKNQRFVLRYDPIAPVGERWTWTLHFTVVYPYFGSAATLQAAKSAAQRKVRSLIGDNERWSE